jgi:hypothetical protein
LGFIHTLKIEILKWLIYYKTLVQFSSPHSLDQWIHYIPTRSCSLQQVNSLKIQWNHFAHMDTLL